MTQTLLCTGQYNKDNVLVNNNIVLVVFEYLRTIVNYYGDLFYYL